MHFFMSRSDRPSLLVIILLIITAGMVLLITYTCIDQGGQIAHRKMPFFPEVFFAFLSLVVCILTFYLHANKKIEALIEETLESLASGIIYFDSREILTRFNPSAAIMVPQISESETSPNYLGTYKKFLAFIYDHSLDIQDQSKLTVDVTQMNLSKLLFREVVELPSRRIVLAQFYQRSSMDVVAVLTDISMLKRQIEEVASLTEENRIMIKAIEAGGSGIMIAQANNEDMPVIFSNEFFAKALGQPVEAILNHSFPRVLEHSFEDQMDMIRAAVSTARKEGRAENIWLKVRTEKSVLWYMMYMLFFRDDNEKEYYVCFLSDRTQAKLSQARIYQTQKLEAVAQLAGGIAHDFNNIFAIIDGYTKLIRRDLAQGSDISDFFETIDRSITRGTQVTGRLLTFGQCRITQRTRLDICAHVKDIEAFLEPLIEKNIHMIISVQDEPCYVDASPDAITQIIMSLASNASDAMQNGGDLIISVADASKSQILSSQQTVIQGVDYICVQIIDSGVGMEIDTLARVYEPFFTTKDPSKNSGLGMSLVYSLVKELDAIIDIKSRPDIGTSVSILIPAREAPRNALFSNPVVSDKTVLTGKTILVVEDSEDLLEMVCRLLTDAKLNVLRAENAEDAFSLQQSHPMPIDFLLVDVTLPGMDGVELSKRFHQLCPETKIILVSGYGEIIKHSDESVILAKPVAYEKLEKALVSSLEDEGWQEKLKENHYWTRAKGSEW